MINVSFEWTENMVIDQGVLDAQHRRWLDIANRLLSIDRPAMQREQTRSTISELYEYTNTHFRTEEAILSRLQYPRLAEQKAQHHRIAADMHCNLLESRHINNLVGGLQQMLKGWVLDHILDEDLLIRDSLPQRVPSEGLTTVIRGGSLINTDVTVEKIKD